MHANSVEYYFYHEDSRKEGMFEINELLRPYADRWLAFLCRLALVFRGAGPQLSIDTVDPSDASLYGLGQ